MSNLNDTVEIKVVVYENGVEKRTLKAHYLSGQPYAVRIETPDTPKIVWRNDVAITITQNTKKHSNHRK